MQGVSGSSPLVSTKTKGTHRGAFSFWWGLTRTTSRYPLCSHLCIAILLCSHSVRARMWFAYQAKPTKARFHEACAGILMLASKSTCLHQKMTALFEPLFFIQAAGLVWNPDFVGYSLRVSRSGRPSASIKSSTTLKAGGQL